MRNEHHGGGRCETHLLLSAAHTSFCGRALGHWAKSQKAEAKTVVSGRTADAGQPAAAEWNNER